MILKGFNSKNRTEQVTILLLQVARQLLENGAETRRVFETTRELSTLFQVDDLNVLVNHRSVIVTVGIESQTLTRNIRVGTLSVNLSKVASISKLVLESKCAKDISITAFKDRLHEISCEPSPYPFPLIVLMVGLACGGFCRIGGGDWIAFFSSSIAASIGFWSRHQLVKAYYEPMLCILVGAFLSSYISSLCSGYLGSLTIHKSIASSVLYLVPGIPMINAISDLLKGHILTGIARSVTVILTAIFVALGLIVAMNLSGLTYKG